MSGNQIEELIILSVSAFTYILLCQKINTRKRNATDKYLQERRVKGRFHTDFNDLVNSEGRFKENCHMDFSAFEELLKSVEPHLLSKKNTRPNDEITPKEKLAVVLEYFASGTLQRHISSVYRISKQHFGPILDQVCNAICSALKVEIPPLSREGLSNTANNFNRRWNFPNCTGAIDGKHVNIKCPKNSGSLFYNYKVLVTRLTKFVFHSLNLMAVADAEYKFIYLDVGGYGSEGDANVFDNCELGKSISKNKLDFPNDMNVGVKKLPYFFVADDAFPLQKRIMKPFVPRKPQKLTIEERIFNYRLSRARRCVENSFGILCSTWYCLARTMFCNPDRAQKIITACCYLHNFLLQTSKDTYCPNGYADSYDEFGQLIEGERRKNIPEDTFFFSRPPSTAGRQNNLAKINRNILKDYCNSDCGSVPWQWISVFLKINFLFL